MKISRIVQLIVLVIICLVSYAIFSSGSGDTSTADSSSDVAPQPSP